ncbi:MAG: hypothetical protein HC896_18565 [Bacteroidales bacterium]|nr:hypothetical protein [Bacteroidales bacterium]
MLYLTEAPAYKAVAVSLWVAFITTVLEATTHKGYDNATIPAGALLVLLLFYFYSPWQCNGTTL